MISRRSVVIRSLPLVTAAVVFFVGAAAADVVRIAVPDAASAPVRFGAAELERELQDAGHRLSQDHAEVTVVISETGALEGVKAPPARESFAVRKLSGNRLAIVGADATGAMYGLLEVAERISWAPGRGVLESVSETTQSPFKRLRGVNPFLHVEALRDPNSWFYSGEFWRSYLDMLARCRFNWLDLHAMYSLIFTNFPNAYPYFLKSEKYPEAGLAADPAQRNLEMLRSITRMAHERGIKVGLMTYHTSWQIPDAPKPDYEESDEALSEYTREMVRRIITAAPELDFIGFRIGESGRREDFYLTTYLPAIAESGRKDIALYTRTWIGDPEMIHRLGREYPGDFFIEIKYNGEHLGCPYQAQGERFADWHSYSYQDYTSYPRDYWIVWQVRANGTHRIFKWGDPEFVRRAVLSFGLAGGVGFTLEPMSAYYPHTDFFHAPGVRHEYFRWMHERDWFWNLLWGRLSYNPECSPRVWQEAFKRRFGAAGPQVLEMVQWMSRVVPLIYSAHCLGPDHRDMAPELETGGAIEEFGAVRALDDTVISSPAEYADEVMERRPSGRLSPLQVADLLLERAGRALAAAQAADAALGYLPDSSPARQEFDCLRQDAEALSHLAGYYAAKLRAAVELELFRRANHLPHLEAARGHAARALDEWKALAEVTRRHYQPFLDILRMHTQRFHWTSLTPQVEQDLAALDELRAKFLAAAPQAGAAPLVGHVPPTRLAPGQSLRVEATVLSVSEVSSATLHYRSGREGDFAALPMRPMSDGRRYFAVIPGAAAQPGRLEYYIEAAAGAALAAAPAQGAKAPYIIEVSADDAPPLVSDLRAEYAPGGETARISAVVSDDSPLRSVRVFYKPMPSTAKWESAPMAEREGRYETQVPLTPQGLLYYVRAVDAALNAAMYPDFMVETPYRVIAPWPRAHQRNRYAVAE